MDATTTNSNIYDAYRAHLADVLNQITGVPTETIHPVIQWTAGLDKGDLVLAVPALRVEGSKPDILAQEWTAKFSEKDPFFQKPVASGPFMSFFAKPQPLTQSIIPLARKLGVKYGHNELLGLKDLKDPSKGKKRIIVEFSSPNVDALSLCDLQKR